MFNSFKDFEKDDKDAWKEEIFSCSKIKKKHNNSAIKNKENIKDTFKLENDNKDKKAGLKNNIGSEQLVFDSKKDKYIDFENKLKLKNEYLKNSSGLDRNTYKKLKKGDYYIDAKLDLHGLTIDEAYIKFLNFVKLAIKYNFRCLLVITGKGLHSEAGSSTIREEFFKWIRYSEISNEIVKCLESNVKHGGKGAFYLFIKKQRE